MRRLLTALACASLISCDKLGSDFGPQIDGTWNGTSNGQAISMSLIQTGNVTGVATITGGTGGTQTLAVSGTFNNPTLTVTFSSTQVGQSIQMDATVAGRSLNGTLTGGGFTGNAVAMTRQD